MDGGVSGRDLGLSVGNDDVDVLVDDAGWDVHRVLDGDAGELVVDPKEYQRTLRVALSWQNSLSVKLSSRPIKPSLV